jgi:hypothetical protein
MPPPTYEYEVPQYEPFTIGPMVITNSTGAPIDLTGKNLIFTASADFTFILTGYAIMVSGVYHNIVYVTSSSNNTQTDQMFVWMLRDASTGNTLAQGLLTVTSPIIGFYCCNPTCATIPLLLVYPNTGTFYDRIPAYEAGVTQCQIANQNTK